MGQKDEAEAELLVLAAHKEASIQICIEALSVVLDASSGAESLKTAASLIIDRFPGETYVPVKIVELIMGQKEEVPRLILNVPWVKQEVALSCNRSSWRCH